MLMKTATVVLSLVMLAAVAALAAAQTARTPQPTTQTPSRDRPTAMPVGTALIQGTVVAADNGRPLSLATISRDHRRYWKFR
jgi:hypothetical protein